MIPPILYYQNSSGKWWFVFHKYQQKNNKKKKIEIATNTQKSLEKKPVGILFKFFTGWKHRRQK